jgi:protocatechuate 3,4-dioxygenase beta subunit
MIMARPSQGRVRHLHLALSAHEFAMIQAYANHLGLAKADAIRLAVRMALTDAKPLSAGVPMLPALQRNERGQE